MKNIFFFILLSGLLACHKETNPDVLLQSLANENRFISSDQLAERIINQDPAILLVDIRPASAFNEFSLPGAINVPLQQFLQKEQQDRLLCRQQEAIFYGDGTVEAEQAWLLHYRLGCKNSKILQGGLNAWAETILQPRQPEQTASAESWETYRFRLAARKFFAGVSTPLAPEPYVEPVAVRPEPAQAKRIPLKAKPVEKEEEEGC